MGRDKDSSTESDEDSNVRHDRFRPERFKDSNPQTISSSKSRDYKYDRYSSKNYRERSPHRSRPRKDYSSQRKESRNKYHDVEKNDRSYKRDSRDHRSSSQSERKHSDVRNDFKVKDDPTKSKSKKLSSILVNFDKKIESKRLDQSDSQIGPALPPHLLKGREKEKEDLNLIELKDSTTNTKLTLPPNLETSNLDTKEDMHNDSFESQSNNVIATEIKSDQPGECDSLSSMGPALPHRLRTKNVEGPGQVDNLQKDTASEMKLSSPINNDNTDLDTFGPVLPPKVEEDSNSYGPALPPNLKKNAIHGPMLPSGMTSEDLEKMGQEESDSEDTFGPLPVGKMNMTQYQLELRAMDIKRKLEEEKSGSSKDINKREEWMLELPPEKASNLGLGPRSFRMKEGPDMSNRSAWTDTPAEKKRKEEMALRGETEPVNSEEMMKTAFVRERNETMDEISKISQDDDRQKSLLEIHQKKLKKKKKKEDKEGKKKERRPFDRNIDLQVHRFDEAQKKAIFKKAQLLDTRFSTGESKYL